MSIYLDIMQKLYLTLENNTDDLKQKNYLIFKFIRIILNDNYKNYTFDDFLKDCPNDNIYYMGPIVSKDTLNKISKYMSSVYDNKACHIVEVNPNKQL